jgi:hypothetical protein
MEEMIRTARRAPGDHGAGGGAGDTLTAIREEIRGMSGAFNRALGRVMSGDSTRFVEQTEQTIGQ